MAEASDERQARGDATRRQRRRAAQRERGGRQHRERDGHAGRRRGARRCRRRGGRSARLTIPNSVATPPGAGHHASVVPRLMAQPRCARARTALRLSTGVNPSRGRCRQRRRGTRSRGPSPVLPDGATLDVGPARPLRHQPARSASSPSGSSSGSALSALGALQSYSVTTDDTRAVPAEAVRVGGRPCASPADAFDVRAGTTTVTVLLARADGGRLTCRRSMPRSPRSRAT